VGRPGRGGCSGPAVAWVSMGVGGSCRDTGSARDLWFSVDQLAQDSAEVVLYSVGSGSRWDWEGCPCSCGWPVDWAGPLWLIRTVLYTGSECSFDRLGLT